jgi:hypothetical protein
VDAKKIDGWQGAVALVGIMAGVVPLVARAFGGGAGLVWRWVPEGPVRWVGPAVVVVAALVAITLLERAKARTG